jgi:TonB-dependent SusC/RagA subfamily outer membrane receptor
MRKWFFLILLYLCNGAFGQTSSRARDNDILQLLHQYFAETPSSSSMMVNGGNGLMTKRKFELVRDSLIIMIHDPKDLISGTDFFDTIKIPMRSINKVALIRENGENGMPGTAIQFTPKKEPYGQVKVEDVGSAGNSKIDEKQLNQVRGSSVGQRIAGQAAGVRVSNDNSPGGAPRINIRGISSVFSGNNPLYIVDDVPMSNINLLNPDDIASIEILKDASATALYGVRGANGVVLIKTKKGGEEENKDEKEILTPYALWVLGSKAREMKKAKDDKRLLDLLQARID